jgi:hypothetical protein
VSDCGSGGSRFGVPNRGSVRLRGFDSLGRLVSLGVLRASRSNSLGLGGCLGALVVLCFGGRLAGLGGRSFGRALCGRCRLCRGLGGVLCSCGCDCDC